MDFVTLIMIPLHLIAIPIVIGRGVARVLNKDNAIATCLINGVLVEIALFQLISVPMILMDKSFSSLCNNFNCILLILCSFVVVYEIKSIKTSSKKISNIKEIFISEIKAWPIISVIMFILIGMQLYFVTFYQVGYHAGDDASYLPQALDAILSDRMFRIYPITGIEFLPSKLVPKRLVTSFIMFMAYLSVSVDVHVAILAHSILPAYYVILSYMVFWYIAKKIYNDNKKRMIVFMCFFSLINWYSGYSVYSYSFRLLVAIWQGKAVLVTIIIPFIIYQLITINYRDIKISTYIHMNLLVTAACASSAMGIGFSLFVILVFSIVMAINRKQFRVLLSGGLFCILSIVYGILFCVLSYGENILWISQT